MSLRPLRLAARREEEEPTPEGKKVKEVFARLVRACGAVQEPAESYARLKAEHEATLNELEEARAGGGGEAAAGGTDGAEGGGGHAGEVPEAGPGEDATRCWSDR